MYRSVVKPGQRMNRNFKRIFRARCCRKSSKYNRAPLFIMQAIEFLRISATTIMRKYYELPHVSSGLFLSFLSSLSTKSCSLHFFATVSTSTIKEYLFFQQRALCASNKEYIMPSNEQHIANFIILCIDVVNK